MFTCQFFIKNLNSYQKRIFFLNTVVFFQYTLNSKYLKKISVQIRYSPKLFDDFISLYSISHTYIAKDIFISQDKLQKYSLEPLYSLYLIVVIVLKLIVNYCDCNVGCEHISSQLLFFRSDNANVELLSNYVVIR